MANIAIAIHGGAGTVIRSDMTQSLEQEYRHVLRQSLEAGWNILKKGGASLDAVEAAVIVLENDTHFNAGRGSVFTNGKKNEMDAAIMNGRNLDSGAVAFVRNIKNPIKLARKVMEETDHLLLAGSGASEFAREAGIEFESDAYFYTDYRYQQLLSAKAAGRSQLDHCAPENDLIDQANPKSKIEIPKSFGTVGAVACDFRGDVAAATSTGGMINKKFGRVGDTPIIGAGTYADNAGCAVSCTGHGEYFMKAVTAYDISARIKYKGLKLSEAADETIRFLTEIGGEGGLIAVDSRGNVALPFNSEGMYRGFMTTEGAGVVEIYK